MSEKINVTAPGGVARTLDEGQISDATGWGSGGGGDFTPITEAEAKETYQREVDTRLADENLGTGSKALMGAFSGSTMGFGPAGLVKLMEGFGDKDAPLARHLMSGAQSSDAYTAGQVAGFVGGSVVTGGVLDEAAAAAKLGALLPEASGILGSTVRGAVGLGSRGAAEGAFMSLGSAAEEAALQNKQLSAEAVLARMGDGILVGGGLGATFGAVGGAVRGALGGSGSVSAALGKGLNKEAAARGLMREMGAGGNALRDIGAMEGGMPGFLERAEKGLESQGLKLSSSADEVVAAARKIENNATKLRLSMAQEFDRVAASASPSWSNFAERVRTEVVGDIAMAPGGVARAEQVAKWLDKVAPYEGGPFANKGFEGWVQGRQLLMDVPGLPAEVGQKVRAMYNEELNQAMLRAEELAPELKGATGRYQAMELTAETFKTLQDVSANRTAINASRGTVRGDDLGAAAAYAMAGHPISGLGYTAGRMGMRALAERYGPAMAEMVWKMSNGQKVTGAVSELNSEIAKGIQTFLKTRNSTLTGLYTEKVGKNKPDKRFSRENYDREMDRANQLINASREERYKYYLKHTGSITLADAMANASEKGAQYVSGIMPPAQSVRQMQTLRPIAKSVVLRPEEHKFLRQWGVVKNPLSALHDLKEGRLSKDTVETLKTVWPETYTTIVAQAQAEVVRMKSEGETLDMSRIAQLSILLDVPLDSTMRKDFIDPVQLALNEPTQEPAKPAPSPGPDASSEDYKTPSEEV